MKPTPINELRDALDDWKFANDKLLRVVSRIKPEVTRTYGFTLLRAIGNKVAEALVIAEKSCQSQTP
jgi:hypothetical protein